MADKYDPGEVESCGRFGRFGWCPRAAAVYGHPCHVNSRQPSATDAHSLKLLPTGMLGKNSTASPRKPQHCGHLMRKLCGEVLRAYSHLTEELWVLSLTIFLPVDTESAVGRPCCFRVLCCGTSCCFRALCCLTICCCSMFVPVLLGQAGLNIGILA